MLLSIWNQKRRLDEITFQIVSHLTFQMILESVVGNSNGQSLPEGLHVDLLQQ